MRFVPLFAILALFLSACGASIDPVLQSKVDRYFAATSGRTVTAGPRFTTPMPYKVGQYTVHTSLVDGKRSISRTAIVGEQNGGLILETYSLSPSSEMTTQMLVTGLDKVRSGGTLDDIDIVWVKSKEGDNAVQSVEGPVLSMMKGFYRKGLVSFDVKNIAYVDGGPVTVPAGMFAGTSKVDTEVSFLGSTYRGTSWHHPSIPINGMVKSQSTDGKSVMELVEFGDNAKPSF